MGMSPVYPGSLTTLGGGTARAREGVFFPRIE